MIAYIAPRRCAEFDKLLKMFAMATKLPSFQEGMNLIIDESQLSDGDGSDLEVSTQDQVEDYMVTKDPFGEKIAFIISTESPRRRGVVRAYIEKRIRNGSKKQYNIFSTLPLAISWAKKERRAVPKDRPAHSSEDQISDDCGAC